MTIYSLDVLLDKYHKIELVSPVSPALAGGFFTIGATWEADIAVAVVILISPAIYSYPYSPWPNQFIYPEAQ